MEDNGRGLDPDPVNTPPVKGGYPNPEELTIMLIGSVGKIRSYKVSRRLVYYASIFFLSYIVISLVIIYLYFSLFFLHRAETRSQKNLETELHEKTRLIEQNKVYIKGLEEYISNNRNESMDEGNKAEVTGKPSTEETGTVENRPGPNEPAKEETAPKEAAVNLMDIEDFTFKNTDSGLTVAFKLANKLAEQQAAEGYVHILAMDKKKEYPPEWNFSSTNLSDGYPIDFKHGQQFLIQRFKEYQRQFKLSPDSELPSFIRILVYDRSGQKILEKEFPVNDVSTNDQS